MASDFNSFIDYGQDMLFTSTIAIFIINALFYVLVWWTASIALITLIDIDAIVMPSS